ncbi:hydrogenase 4 subunit D [Pyrococcus abyssi]|nr:hydrogenase 4 subunit D [Pyrococcus abyssi]CCE70928.1 TPA: hydrogenase 4 subunit D [Pyrococcus abyssi GE5]
MTPELFLLSSLIPIIVGIVMFKLDGKVADWLMVLTSLSSLLLVSFGMLEFLSEGSYHVTYLRTPTLGEVYGIIVDPMSVLIGFVVALAGFLFLLYSIDYMSPRNSTHPVHKDKGRFYAWMLIFLGSTLGFIYSSTLLQLLVFFELMSLACWGVVSYYGTESAVRAAYKAFIIPNFGAVVGLYTALSISITKLHDLSLYSLQGLDAHLKLVLFLGVMIAAFTKSAQFPFYSWLPDAMEAPTPASAFLHGAAMIEMGVYLLARIIQFMSPIPQEAFYVMLTLLAITQVLAIIYYPLQRDAKRLLAYSTISEAGIMYVGLLYALLGNAEGIQASMFQLFNHAFVKGLAFLSAGTFAYSFGTLDMEKIRGIRWSMPVVAVGWFLALLGLAGAPPFGIFFSKAYIVMSSKLASQGFIAWIPVLLVLIDATVFFIVSVLWLKTMLFGEPTEKREEITPLMKAVLLALIILSVVAPLISYRFVTGIGFVR